MNASTIYNPWSYGTNRPPPCPYCRAEATLVNGVVVYPDKPEFANRKFWYCGPCGAWCSVHDNSPRLPPLGSLANAELRVQRKQVYFELDQVRELEKIDRTTALHWLAKSLGRESKRLHISDLREADCMSALLILAARLNRLRRGAA
jgi:zinc-finger-containing domain